MTAIPSELAGLAAVKIAERVRAGHISAVDVVQSHLARIEVLDPKLRAFAHVRRDQALEDAVAVDLRADRGSLPLAGVPVAVKDNLAVAGSPLRHGSRATPTTPAEHDDELVRRLRAAGAVIVGVTRMPELAIWPFTEFEGDDPVRNPWAHELTGGGSSGGAAVAVTTGMAALAVGSDGGGSLRVPAACCGIVGFKPTSGLVPLAGGLTSHWRGLTQWGPLAASVGDAALLLDVLAGKRRHSEVAAPTAPLRVAVSVKPAMAGARMHPECRQVTQSVAEALRGAGHQVIEADPPYPKDLGPRFSRRWLAGIAEDARGLDHASLEERSRRMARAGRSLDRIGLAAGGPDAKLAARMRVGSRTTTSCSHRRSPIRSSRSAAGIGRVGSAPCSPSATG